MKRYGIAVLAVLLLATLALASGQWVRRWVTIGSDDICVMVPAWASHRKGADGMVRPLMDKGGNFVNFGEYDVYKTKEKP